ncbi:MAG: hypothetical protein WBD46_00760 [Acidobacteriaceae bacterium]
MEISDAQRDVRTTFLGGFAGQLVPGLIWLASAALATWRSPRAGILLLVFGGMAIYPLTQLALHLMGRQASLPKGHPMNSLARQIAFIVPAGLPLIGAAALHRLDWFYPAFLIVIGAHYLPFTFLYGMRQFGALAAAMIAAGVAIGWFLPGSFALGGWLGAALLFVFAFTGRAAVRAEPA